jgi:hypothetical protein
MRFNVGRVLVLNNRPARCPCQHAHANAVVPSDVLASASIPQSATR